ncbi:MAG: tetratricopeptide repeat protein, partial [Nitrospirota bacterium]
LTFEEPLTGARLDTHNLPKEEPFEPLHLEFSRQVFIEAMKVAMDITEKRTIMPILSHVHLKSDAPNGEYTSCTLEATDLQITWVRRIHGKGDAVNRCIPGKLLMNEIKALPDGANVELTFSRHAVSVNGRCEILTPDAEEFPEIKVNAGVEQPDAVLIENLSDGLKQVFPAISTDETRYVLTAVLIDPENDTAMVNLADQYYKMDKADEAIKYYVKALELNPDNPRACYQLGLIYFKLGRNREALDSFKKAANLAPGSEVAAASEKYIELLK